MAARRVVVGVDGSPAGMDALDWAAGESLVRGVALEVVHAGFAREVALEALAPGLLASERSVLDEAVARARGLAPGVAVSGRLCEPPAGAALVAASEGAELLVVGSRGLSRLDEITLGSVSSECAHHAHCPVVIVRPGTGATRRADDVSRARAPAAG